MQNAQIIHAVMAQRIKPQDGPDNYPAPPWATQEFIEHIIPNKEELPKLTCLEPACGAGHMAKVLHEYFGDVQSADAYDSGYGEIRDFLTFPVQR